MAEHKQRFVRLRSATTGEWFAPQELRPRLVDEAEAQGSNLTEVVIGILARAYKVPFEPNGRRTSPSEDGEELNLRVPNRLDKAIAVAAARNGREVPGEIIATLCEHFGLALPTAA